MERMQDLERKNFVKRNHRPYRRTRDDYQILLAHHPGYMKEYLAYGADLILGGHYHGCLVQLRGSVESFRRILHCFQSIPGNLPGRRTDSSCKPRTWDAFGAVKTVELAGADCSGIIRK